MTGKASPLAASVINEIAQAIALGDSLDPIRSKCSSVPRRTWHNWIRKARELAETSGPPKPKKPKRFEDISAGDFGTAAESGASAGAAPMPSAGKRRRPKSEPLQPTRTTPPQTDSGVTPPAPGSELGEDNADDPIPGNRTTRRLRDPDAARESLIDITGELLKSMNYADALLETCVMKVGDNHTIVDPVGYAAALAQRTKAVESLFKAYERVTNADQLAAFCRSVMQRVSALSPDTAKAIAQDMREMVGTVNPRLWQTSR